MDGEGVDEVIIRVLSFFRPRTPRPDHLAFRTHCGPRKSYALIPDSQLDCAFLVLKTASCRIRENNTFMGTEEQGQTEEPKLILRLAFSV
jgi:hypothetical protein